MLRLCVTSVHIISVHKGKHPAPACEECFLEGFRCKRLRVWGYILIGVCFTATVTFSVFFFSEAAWCVVINEAELRVKTLHTAEVSLSKVLNRKQQLCCKLWPLTPPQCGGGRCGEFMWRTLIIGATARKTETTIDSRASFFYLCARLHPVCPIWSRCLQSVKGHKWSKDTEVKAPSAVTAAAAQTWSTHFWVQCDITRLTGTTLTVSQP